MDFTIDTDATIFQPTLPARGATRKKWYRDATRTFQPTLPARGATQNQAAGLRLGRFQPTLPARGATGRDNSRRGRHAFQPTLPARGATCTTPRLPPRGTFQPTLPARGATPPRGTNEAAEWHFNPRSPHGERRAASRQKEGQKWISTHAPRTGSDLHNTPTPPAGDISTHAPRTGSDNPTADPANEAIAISTHAPRTGSDWKPALPRRRRDISTHAPRTGSDFNPPDEGRWHGPFQPTLPARGATLLWLSDNVCPAFQPTLPARGATPAPVELRLGHPDFNPRSPHGERHFEAHDAAREADISTHAPRTGSDLTRLTRAGGTGHFNPRSPHGERPDARTLGHRERPFQPTLPARGATAGGWLALLAAGISTHAPRTGSDAAARARQRPPAISTHAPRTGSDDKASINSRLTDLISTHAPRTGSDVEFLRQIYQLIDFNPRSPHGERRYACGDFHCPHCISTHAPRTGSDAAEAATVRPY